MREIRWKCIFRANFSLLPQVFAVGAVIPQGLPGARTTLDSGINCKSLKEIGEMACVTPAWSSRGQTLNSSRRFLTLMHLMPGRNSFSFQLSGG